MSISTLQAALRPRITVPSGLVGYWSLDLADLNSTKTTAYDRARNNHCAVTGSPSMVRAKIRQGLVFDTTGKYGNVTVEMATEYPFSMGCWVNPRITTDATTFTSYVSNLSTQYFCLEIRSGKFSIVARNTTFFNSLSTTSVVVGNWFHIFGAWVSATARLLYVNGRFEAINTDSVAFFSSPRQLFLGRLRATDTAGMSGGTIDDARFYNRALSAQEILSIYEAGRCGRA